MQVWYELPAPTLDALARVRRLLHALGQRDVAHVLDVAFQSCATLLTELQLRLAAYITNALDDWDRQLPNHRLQMPANLAKDTLPVLEALISLLMKVADAHGKYRHVSALAGRRAAAEPPPSAPRLVDERGPAESAPDGSAAFERAAGGCGDRRPDPSVAGSVAV